MSLLNNIKKDLLLLIKNYRIANTIFCITFFGEKSMDLKKLIMFNDKIKQTDVQFQDITSSLSESVLIKKDVLNHYLKVMLTSLIGFLLFSNIAVYLFSLHVKGHDVRVLFAVMFSCLSLLFILLPLTSLTKKSIYLFKGFLFNKDATENLFSRGMSFTIISVFSLFLLFLTAASAYYSSNNDTADEFKFVLGIVVFVFHYGIFITLGLLTISSLYHHQTVNGLFSNGDTLEQLNEKLKSNIDNKDNIFKELKTFLKSDCKHYNEVEYIKDKADELSLDYVLQAMAEVEDDIAQLNGFNDYLSMKKDFIENNFKQHNIFNG